MNLKPQDILFLLKLVSVGRNPWSFNKIALDLGMSPSEIHAASKRTLAARLAIKEGSNIWPNMRNLEEFILHGLQYVFIPERGALNRGMPTAYAAAPMDAYFARDNEPPPVWPDPEGKVRGESFSPLYKSAPFAAKNDPALYELLALVDAIRGGNSREREIARKELKMRFSSAEEATSNQLVNDQDKLVIGGSLVVSRTALKKLAQRYHIRRLALFGSAARGQLNPDSDIDLLAEFENGKAPSLGGMVKINDDFVTLFGGRKVNVSTPAILKNPYRQRAIERDIEELYAA
ncbi:MAG: nucleotidyltransferase domain-containing protein [Proteobacteria bacterium]|nr:nucleotidyltransferase domain-containing protein [Pseudomonadota bacterium]